MLTSTTRLSTLTRYIHEPLRQHLYRRWVVNLLNQPKIRPVRLSNSLDTEVMSNSLGRWFKIRAAFPNLSTLKSLTMRTQGSRVTIVNQLFLRNADQLDDRKYCTIKSATKTVVEPIKVNRSSSKPSNTNS